ncbi:WD40 repeat domain-containing protein [Streptoalloteichus hindustanus]|uniref:PQQ-like beta-propeller repeat protein n=1 Tax=Streptoalloteichus hindustanus TaxID=2017 RepID=UPI0011612EDE|nr:PQQ-like beta-propeller repeat protein [Streptoalloteichus hindustanus]
MFVPSAALMSVGADGRVYLVDSQSNGQNRVNYLLRMAPDGSARRGLGYLAGADTLTSATANKAGYVATSDAHFAGAVRVLGPDLDPEPLGRWVGCYNAVNYDAPRRVEAGAVSGRFYALAQDGLSAPGEPGKLADPTPHIVAVGSPPEPITALARYPLSFPPADPRILVDFRVRETGAAPDFAPVFYVLYQLRQERTRYLAKIDQTGTVLWKRTDPVIQQLSPARTEGGCGFDVDAAGHVYVVEPQHAVRDSYLVHRYHPDNATLEPTRLTLTGDFPPPVGAPYRELRVRQNQVLLQRRQDRELYSVFDLPDPSTSDRNVVFRRSVSAQHDHVRARFLDEPTETAWTAGSTVRIALTVDRVLDGQRERLPVAGWRAWLRSVGGQDHRRIDLVPDSGDPTLFRLTVPADISGLRQLTLAPTTGPYRIGAAPHHRLRRIVEVRPAGATGSVSLATITGAVIGPNNEHASGYRGTLNRARYAAGEPITFSVSVRPTPSTARDLVVRLADATGTTAARATVRVPTDKPPQVTVTVPAAVTRRLRPGDYLLTADAPGMTVATQPIAIGTGHPISGYRRVWFGDHTELWPTADEPVNSPFSGTHWDDADIAAAYLERVRRQGWTIVVDRLARQSASFALGHPDWDAGLPVIGPTKSRLDADPTAVDSIKLRRLSTLLEAVSGFGMLGIRQRATLLDNDATLPWLNQIDTSAETNNDSTRPIDRYFNLFRTNAVFSAYRAFEGWQWAGNWWANEGSPDDLPYGPMKPHTGPYVVELEATRKDGKWRPLLAAMQEYGLSHGPEAQRHLRRALAIGAAAGMGRGDLVTSFTGPFRHILCYPPETFTDVDEVDLQAQWEQFPLMLHTAFGVDFYPRPGKPSTLHQENLNDSGTGDQILGQAFAALLRGAKTSGHADTVPRFRQRTLLPDPRSLVAGTPSVFRVLADLLHEYGEWIGTFDNADRVAILVSRRQFGVDRYRGDMTVHFRLLHEAYLALLYAQIPASLVFVEDLAVPGVRPLSDYAAVLLVDERVEPEPAVLAALRTARRVFHTDTCADIVTAAAGSTSLGHRFDQSEYEKFPAVGHDCSFQSSNPNVSVEDPNTKVGPKSWHQISLSNAAAMRAALGPVVGGDRATADDPQVLVSERRKGAARIVVAVNNSLFAVDNVFFRRAGNFAAVTAPLTTTLTLPAAPVVYDVLAGRRVTPTPQGRLPVDFRHWPVAIYALLPAPVTGVTVTASASQPGEVGWWIRVSGGSGADPDLPLPVRVRIRDAAGALLWQQYTTAPASGRYQVPVNAHGSIRVEALELLTGQSATTDSGVRADDGPLDLLTGAGGGVGQRPAAEPTASAPASAPVADWRPAVERLGAHVRDIVLTDDGGAVLAAANWDTNLFALDLATGAQRWQTRIGHQFTHGLRRFFGGVAVQGMVLDAPHGYGLHLVNTANGAVERRFDLHGTQPSWFYRFSAAMPDGQPPAFATSPSGAWVATAGNLGLALWRRDGTLLGRRDWWEQAPLSDRPGAASDALLAALDENTLLVITRGIATAYQVNTLTPKWRQDLDALVTAVGGQATAATLSPDGATVAVSSTADSGRVFLLASTDGAVKAKLPIRADEVAWGPDGTSLVTLHDTRLDQHRLSGATWAPHASYPGADVLHHLAVAADGRIACGDEQGNLVVLTADLEPALVTDVTGIPVPRWLPGGDLLVATWLGQATRLHGATYQPLWSTTLRSTAQNMRSTLLAPEKAPTARITVTGNGVPPTGQANLLTPDTAGLSFVGFDSKRPVALPAEKQFAPHPEPPDRPHLSDPLVEFLSEAFPLGYLHVLLREPKATVTFGSLTLWDDPAHPESWLRDLRLDIRATPGDVWKPVARLVSHAAARTYPLPGGRQVTAAEIRLVVPPGLPGNLRLAGIALHAPP